MVKFSIPSEKFSIAGMFCMLGPSWDAGLLVDQTHQLDLHNPAWTNVKFLSKFSSILDYSLMRSWTAS